MFIYYHSILIFVSKWWQNMGKLGRGRSTCSVGKVYELADSLCSYRISSESASNHKPAFSHISAAFSTLWNCDSLEIEKGLLTTRFWEAFLIHVWLFSFGQGTTNGVLRCKEGSRTWSNEQIRECMRMFPYLKCWFQVIRMQILSFFLWLLKKTHI